MTATAEGDPRFPIGRFCAPEAITAEDRAGWIEDIAAAPSKLRAAVAGLTADQFDTPYREGGWTVRQVVHHVPDSHMNAIVRFKLALTEIDPVIKPYKEAEWAKLGDTAGTPIETSLVLLENLHERWVVLLRGLSTEGWQRQFVHPEMGPVPLARSAGLYAWHGKHHTAHITELRRRRGWL
jgi:uncharacterized damage-inducible protein DinB